MVQCFKAKLGLGLEFCAHQQVHFNPLYYPQIRILPVARTFTAHDRCHSI